MSADGINDPGYSDSAQSGARLILARLFPAQAERIA
jgi:hypothetical protein